MQREDFHILIVDDDITLGKAMAEALSRAGFKTTHTSKPEDALNTIRFQSVHAAVIDCMLPKLNGVELAKRLRREVSDRLPIILVSGIYKDKSFHRDALQSTGAVAFLTKPFEIRDFVDSINEALKLLVDAPVSMIHQFLAKQEVTAKQRIRAVDEAETIHSFDLPWVISLLLDAKVSGHLNIISADGDVSGIGFLAGEIVQVYQDDAKSYFGVLLVEHGFISQAELDEVTKSAGSTKKLGEKLVEANVLSPHAIQIVMAEQQGLRLSKVINNTSVKVNFIETAEMRVNARTDRNSFTELLNEWLVSKYSLDWLKSYYTPWMRFNLKKGPEWSPESRALILPVVLRIPNIVETLLESGTLEAALAKIKQPEHHVYRALHALIVSRVLRFGDANTQTDYNTQKDRLQKLLSTLRGQNHFERLGVSQKAKESELKRAYHDLTKVLHPEKLSPEAPTEVRQLANQTFQLIEEAYTTLSDSKAKDQYLKQLEKDRAESAFQAEQLAAQARPLLSKGDTRKAMELLDKALSLTTPTSELRLLMMWAKIKSPNGERDKKLQQEVKDELSQIPPEDRHDATYFFVKAVILRVTGDVAGAKRNLDHVLAQSPDFIDARRELTLLQQQQDQVAKNNTNLLNGDLKDVVGMLFKKRK